MLTRRTTFASIALLVLSAPALAAPPTSQQRAAIRAVVRADAKARVAAYNPTAQYPWKNPSVQTAFKDEGNGSFRVRGAIYSTTRSWPFAKKPQRFSEEFREYLATPGANGQMQVVPAQGWRILVGNAWRNFTLP